MIVYRWGRVTSRSTLYMIVAIQEHLYVNEGMVCLLIINIFYYLFPTDGTTIGLQVTPGIIVAMRAGWTGPPTQWSYVNLWFIVAGVVLLIIMIIAACCVAKCKKRPKTRLARNSVD
jgi:hypothetical protein